MLNLMMFKVLYFSSVILFYIYFMEVQLKYNVVPISALQQNDSFIYMYIYIYTYTFFKNILFYHSLSQEIGYSSLQFPVLHSRTSLFVYPFFFFFFFFWSFVFFRAMAHGGSQARRQIRAVAAGLHHSHVESEPRLQPTPQLTVMPDP